MRTHLDCLPCLLRQAIEASRLVSKDGDFQEKICRRALAELSHIDFRSSPPVMAQRIHRILRQTSGLDPYKEIKMEANRLAMSLLPLLEKKVRSSPAPLETAMRLAIAGNVIDMGVGLGPRFEAKHLHASIDQSLTSPLDGNTKCFAEAVQAAERILYLMDNAGEIAFDRLLISLLPKGKVTAVVKRGPVINDATMADAEEVGLPDLAPVVDNGSDGPGTIMGDCSDTFLKLFSRADLIIAKGQAHYETLSDEKKNIFFLLKAKCPVVAEALGCRVGDMILRRAGAGSD